MRPKGTRKGCLILEKLTVFFFFLFPAINTAVKKREIHQIHAVRYLISDS